MRRVVCLAYMLIFTMLAAGCASRRLPSNQTPQSTAASAHSRAPIWAAQFAWSPAGSTAGGIQIQYNSPTQPYCRTAAMSPESANGKWCTSVWKLNGVDFAGRQNWGADLRLQGSRGVAVHQVTLSTLPPGASVANTPAGQRTVRITFNTSRKDNRHIKINNGMYQLAVGGHKGDSLYAYASIRGRGAEVFANNASYIYLRLSRESRLFLAHPSVVYATVTWAATLPPAVWPESTFAHIAADGIHYAELNMSWAAVEPEYQKFNFHALDQTLANAAAAHVRIIPLFWLSVWGGNPPAWITHYDIGSSGARSRVPTWWNHFNRQSYFKFVTTTISHIKNNPAFGGAFLDYGWLDYMWGPPPGGRGVNGYARQDIAQFHHWLPGRYHSLAAFNGRFHTRFTSWDAVPAAAPGEPLFPVYQHFRNWSVIETYRRLTALVRRITSAPLYYYWGGGYSGAGVAFNLPDSFFQLARRYHVTVCEDCADHTGLMLLFGSLAKAYKVPLFEEWTPRPTGLHAEFPQFLGHYGFGEPQTVGMDFFLYHGGHEFNVGYPEFVRWTPVLSKIHGVYPFQPVAVYLSYQTAFSKPAALAGTATRLAAIWRKLHVAFTVVTDREIKVGVVGLNRFRAVYPFNGRHNAIIEAYRDHRGKVLRHAAELARYAPAYLTLSPAYKDLEAVPTTDPAAREAWISLCPWQFAKPFKGTVTIHLPALGLPPGNYKIVNVATGQPVASTGTMRSLRAALRLAPGNLIIWKIVINQPNSTATATTAG